MGTPTFSFLSRLSQILLHPEYNGETSWSYDIALIKLSAPADPRFHWPACLPTQDADYTGQMGWMYGENDVSLFNSQWGTIFQPGENPRWFHWYLTTLAPAQKPQRVTRGSRRRTCSALAELREEQSARYNFLCKWPIMTRTSCR